MKQSCVRQPTDMIEAGIKCLQTEAFAQIVIVAYLVNFVVVNVQPFQRLGNKGKVEPLKIF